MKGKINHLIHSSATNLFITILIFVWIIFFRPYVSQLLWVLVFESMFILKNVLDLIEDTENEDDMKKGKKLLLDKSISVLAISTGLMVIMIEILRDLIIR